MHGQTDTQRRRRVDGWTGRCADGGDAGTDTRTDTRVDEGAVQESGSRRVAGWVLGQTHVAGQTHVVGQTRGWTDGHMGRCRCPVPEPPAVPGGGGLCPFGLRSGTVRLSRGRSRHPPAGVPPWAVTETHPGHEGTTLLPALSQSPAGNHASSQSPAGADAADQWQTSFFPLAPPTMAI